MIYLRWNLGRDIKRPVLVSMRNLFSHEVAKKKMRTQLLLCSNIEEKNYL
jgi:hypothetical protein